MALRGTGPVVLLALLAALAPRLQAADVTVANQLEAYYDTDLRESLLDDRLDASLRQGPFSLGVTLLSHSPSNDAVLDPNNLGPQQQGIRKRWLEARTDDLALRLGDVYATFGRGMALQIYEDQVVDFDNVIDGVYGSVDQRALHAQFIGGTNSYGPSTLVLKGAELAAELPAGFRLGTHGVWTDYLAEIEQTRTGGDRLYGGFLGGSLLGRADVYGEYVLRDQRDASGGKAASPRGHAGYANLNLYLGPLQILSEYRELLRYDLPKIQKEDKTPQAFVNPPTAVRQHQTTLLNRGSHVANINAQDERGGLVQAYIALREETHATLAYSRAGARHAASFPSSGSVPVFADSKLPAWETYGELEQWMGERAEVILRLAESEETVNKGYPAFFERITGGASVLYTVTEAWSIDFTWESQETQESNQALIPESYLYSDYRDHTASLTLSKSPNMSWALTGEWTTNPTETRASWIWGEWNLLLGDRNQMTLGFGRLRGGQVCSGGVCRIVDPFEGGRLEVQTTF